MADIRQISPELAEKARIELNEDEKRIPQDIAALREWILKQPHLKSRTNDQFLLTFLRGSKYSLEKAKQKIDSFLTFKSVSPEVFSNNRITERSMELARIGPFVALPKPLKPDGPAIVLFPYKGLEEFSYVEICKNHRRLFDILMLENDNSVIGGVMNIVDLAQVSVGFILKFDLVLGKKVGVFWEKALPFRLKGVHVINFPKELLTFLKIFRNFLTKKTKERLIFHSSIESLYEYVPQEYLPEEYGGNNGCIRDCIENMGKLLLKYNTYFDEDDQYRSNEKLRVGEAVSSESLFGLDGSFRKLEVD